MFSKLIDRLLTISSTLLDIHDYIILASFHLTQSSINSNYHQLINQYEYNFGQQKPLLIVLQSPQRLERQKKI
jgi:hypothetical protein